MSVRVYWAEFDTEGSGGAITGTASFTESSDTASASGHLIHRGTAEFSEANDTAAASGRRIHYGSAAFTEMAIPTAAEIATAIYANTIDGKTLTQHIRLLSAVLGGKVSGAGTGTETFRDIADTVDRVVATVDSSGNRTAITLDLD